MSSIDPNIDPGAVDASTRYAIDTERSELFKAQIGLGRDRAVHDHAISFVDKPLQVDALKSLLGESKRRWWAYFQLPQGDARNFIFDSPKYTMERLETNLKVVKQIDCTCNDKVEQETREKEKVVLEAFCEKEIELKRNYDAARMRILEFVQG